jgi:hypothetical protein
MHLYANIVVSAVQWVADPIPLSPPSRHFRLEPLFPRRLRFLHAREDVVLVERRGGCVCVCVCVCVGAAPVDEAGCRRRPRTVRVGEWATGMKSDSVSAAASVFGSRNGSRVTRDTPDTVCGGLHKPGSETDYVLLGSCTPRSPSRGLPKHYPTATARYRTQESDPRWYRLTRSWRLRYFVHPCPRGLSWCGFKAGMLAVVVYSFAVVLTGQDQTTSWA